MGSFSGDFDVLKAHVASQFAGELHSNHGPAHWARVERNGLLLATRTGADIDVVRLFALFHDAKRIDDLTDEGHGARAAAYALELRGTLFELDDASMSTLQEACEWHTDRIRSADPTLGTCWDADRLDLGRVGITPAEEFMSTAFGKEIARTGSLYPFLSTIAP